MAEKNLTSLPVIHMRPCEDGEGVRPMAEEEVEKYKPPKEALEALAKYLYPIIHAHFISEAQRKS